MPTDAVPLLPWLLLAVLGLAALAAWLRRRNGSSNLPEEVVVEVGNRTRADVWAMREEWMPAVSHFVDESL